MKPNTFSRVGAFETLIKYGVIIPMGTMNLYHGRVGEMGEEFLVDPEYSNEGNKTGNHNVYGISSLSVASREIAAEFAYRRYIQSGRDDVEMQVHRIEPNKGEKAYIFNNKFNIDSLPANDAKNVTLALQELSCYSVSRFDTVKFEYKQEYAQVFEFLKRYCSKNNINGYISFDDCHNAYREYSRDHHTQEEFFIRIAGSQNVKRLFINRPSLLFHNFAFVEGSNNRQQFNCNSDNKIISCPFNVEYAAGLIANNHIIGVQTEIDSATLKRQCTSCFIFDKKKVGTLSQVGDRYQEILNEFGILSQYLSQVSGLEGMDNLLRDCSCEEIVEHFRRNKSVGSYYSVVPPHIWEGIDIGEHTEAVLRGFDNTYASSIPPDLLPFIKTIILSHDLGKGTVDRSKEKAKNAELCRKLYNQMKIPHKIQELMLFVINESQYYTSDYYIKKNVHAKNTLKIMCTRKLQELFGTGNEGLVKGLMSVCDILQNCDSISYTRYGIVRDRKTGVYFNGGNDGWTKGARVVPGGEVYPSGVLKDPDESTIND